MIRNKNPKKSKPKAKPKGKGKPNKVLCEQCGMEFSKSSNLNRHIQKVHKGLRWRCHLCAEEQVSKHSHIRHFNSKHEGELPINIDANQRYATVFIDMPERAKDSIIKDLSARNEVHQVLLKSMRKRLLKTLKENIKLIGHGLKAKLDMDCENDKLEYNNLIGCEDSSESDENSCSEQSCNSVVGGNDENDDDDTTAHDISTSFPDQYPVSIDAFVDDPEAGGSNM